MTNREKAIDQLIDQLRVLRDNSDPLATLRGMVWLQEDLGAVGFAAAQEARSNGDSWADVGEALGITRQAAQQRLGGS